MIEFSVMRDPAELQTPKKIEGVVAGRVINLLDPQGLGRIQVQLPFIDSVDLSPWARVAVPMAGLLHGHYFLPNMGDEVLLAFEQGNPDAPYIIGSLWNAISRPPLPSPLPQIRGTRTPTGNQVVFTEVPPMVTIQNGPTPPAVMPAPPTPTAPYSTIMLTPAGIQMMSAVSITLQVGTTTLAVTPAGIMLQTGGSTVNVTPAGVVITAPAVTVIGSAQVEITGLTVRINS